MRKLLSSVEENFTLKMLIFCVRTENFYVVVLVDKEYIVSPVRGLNLMIYVYTSELGTPHTVCDHLKLRSGYIYGPVNELRQAIFTALSLLVFTRSKLEPQFVCSVTGSVIKFDKTFTFGGNQSNQV